MTTILVTGSTGNIGNYVVTELLKREAKVRAVVTNIERAKTFFQPHPNLEIAPFDFLQPSTYPAALKDIKKIFLIRPPQLAKPKKDILPFLQAAKSAGVEHIVFVSLIGVEKNPVVPHHKIENLILEIGFTYTFLRPSFFMQNLNTTHREDISIRNELYIPVGKAKTSFIDTRDIGEAAAICLTHVGHENKKYELTGLEALSYDEVATIMSRILGRKIVYINPNVFAFRKTCIKRGMPKGFANVMTMLYTMTKFGTAKTITHDLEKILTHNPITFEQYVKDHKGDFNKK
ncbi:SDR family oxidoreductase [Paenibacillus marinisediminis]